MDENSLENSKLETSIKDYNGLEKKDIEKIKLENEKN